MKVKLSELKNVLKKARLTVRLGKPPVGVDLRVRVQHHLVFRCEVNGAVEVLSFNGRTFSSTPLKVTDVEVTGNQTLGGTGVPIQVFTVEARRLITFCNNVDAAEVIIEPSPEDLSRVSVRAGSSSASLQSVSTESFPWWDNTYKAAKHKGNVDARVLQKSLEVLGLACGSDETRRADLASVVFRVGKDPVHFPDYQDAQLFATDLVNLAVVTIPGLEACRGKFYGKDISTVRSYLNLSGHRIRVFETDDTLILKCDDGSYFGQMYMHMDIKFPGLYVQGYVDNTKVWWSVASPEIKQAIKILSVSMDEDEHHLIRLQVVDGDLELAVKSMVGDEVTQRIPCACAMKGKAKSPTIFLNYKNLHAMLSLFNNEEVAFGVELMRTRDIVQGYVLVDVERKITDEAGFSYQYVIGTSQNTF